jgi:hypothetical protein
MLIFVEPEGWDCWLSPNESAELRADAESPESNFEVGGIPGGIVVWPSVGMGVIGVWSGSRELECGYGRPAGWPVIS